MMRFNRNYFRRSVTHYQDGRVEPQDSPFDADYKRFAEKIKSFLHFDTIKITHIKWRSDINLWETKYIFLDKYSFFKYSIWESGNIKNGYSLSIRSPRTCTKNLYAYCTITEIRINQKDFYERYNGNKWIVPINVIVELL